MKDTINVNCPVAATLQLIGGKYKALLLWHLSRTKILRFNGAAPPRPRGHTQNAHPAITRAGR